MAIYLRVEVQRRELDGRLLLGLVLADRGHDVVLGRIPYSGLLDGKYNDWTMPPGVIHLKSLNVTPRLHEWLKSLRRRGFVVTAQDEEHGLAGPEDYGSFAERRLSREQLSEAARYLAWGSHDGAWLRDAYPEMASRISVTGSPRIDLFREELLDAAPSVLPVVAKPYVLIVSSASPFSTNPLWLTLGLERESAGGIDEAEEQRAFRGHARRTIVTGQLLAAARRVQRRLPGAPVVIRPHHFEAPDSWESVVGSDSGLIVARSGPSVSWISGAAVVVHSGSTVAMEATVAGKPVVSFVPQGALGPRRVNSFGVPVADVASLVDMVQKAWNSPQEWAPILARDRARLSPILHALDGQLAADRAADVLGPLDTTIGSAKLALGNRAQLRSGLRRALGPALKPAGVMKRRLRARSTAHSSTEPQSLISQMDFAHKFPSLDFDALTETASRIGEKLGRFSDVRMTRIGPKEVLLRRQR